MSPGQLRQSHDLNPVQDTVGVGERQHHHRLSQARLSLAGGGRRGTVQDSGGSRLTSSII